MRDVGVLFVERPCAPQDEGLLLDVPAVIEKNRWVIKIAWLDRVIGPRSLQFVSLRHVLRLE